jgi:NTE family protein
MSRKNTREQIALLRSGDILLQPDLGTIRGLNFERSTEAIALGARAAEQTVDALRRLSISESDYAEWRNSQRRRMTDRLTVADVRVENGGRVANRTLEKRMGLKPGQKVKVEELRRGLDRIYDVGAFDSVDFRLVPTNGVSEVVVRPVERATGRVHVRAGLKLFSDLDGDSDFNFLTSVTATELNRLGAEWKNKVQFGRTTLINTEWYQPLDYARSWFVAPHAEFLQDRKEAVQADGTLLRAKYRSLEGGVDGGAQLGNAGELRVGPAWGQTRIYELHGVTLPNGQTPLTHAGAHARLTLDQLDNVNFPRAGYIGGLELYSSREELGADLDYNRLSGGWDHAFSYGENTLLAGFHFGAKLGSDLPFYENFSLGGFLNLLGMPFEGLSDQYSGLARLIYYRRVMRLNKRVVDSIYVGASAEAGGVWRRFDEIDSKGVLFAGSAFVGVDTMFGPLYLAYGQAEGGNHACYFYLGRGF